MGGLKLNNPKSAGDLDEGEYEDIRVSHVDWDLTEDTIVARAQFGNFDNDTGAWTPGVLPTQDVLIRDGIPDGTTLYTIIFDETFKKGGDTNTERFLEMVTTAVAINLGVIGTAIKPGKSGKKKI